MKNLKKTLGLLLAVMLVCALALAATASAADAFTYTPVAGTSATFVKYLVMPKDANVPNATFTYSIAPGTAIDPTTTTLAVFPGPVVQSGETVTAPAITGTSAGEVKFAPSFGTTDGAADDGIANSTELKYAHQTVTVDLSGVSFDEPGVYRYVITEAGTNQGVTNDSNLTRTLDVYVTDNGSGVLNAPVCVLHTGTAAPAITAVSSSDSPSLTDKSDGYINTYAAQNLTISKSVSGNQASHDKFFAITVEITNAVGGTKYTVDLSNAVAAPTQNSATKFATMSNPAEIVVPADATSVTQVFYLQHGNSIVIKGLAKDTSYTVTEDAEDYNSSNPNGITGTIGSADATAAFTNTRNGAVPTGVMMSVIPGVAIVLAAAAALALVSRKKTEA